MYVTTAPSLDLKDLKEVKNFIWDAYTKWYHIGTELELHHSTLEAIKIKFNNDPAECFTQMLVDWLNGQGLDSTWENIYCALKAPPVKLIALAEKVERKYHHPDPESSVSKTSVAPNVNNEDASTIVSSCPTSGKYTDV